MRQLGSLGVTVLSVGAGYVFMLVVQFSSFVKVCRVLFRRGPVGESCTEPPGAL